MRADRHRLLVILGRLEMSMRAAVVVVLCTVPAAWAQVGRGAQATETYESATIDVKGHLVIVKAGGHVLETRSTVLVRQA